MTETQLIFAAVAVVVPGILVLAWFLSRNFERFHSAVDSIARDYGLRSGVGSARGRIDSLLVEVAREELGGSDGPQDSFAIRVTLDGTSRFRITKAGLKARIEKAAGQPDIQLGVPSFDRRCWVRGSDAPSIVARLPAQARHVVLELLEHGGRLQHDRLEQVWSEAPSEQAMREALDRLLAAGRALSLDEEGVPGALLRHALVQPDPEAGYRRRCLELLFKHFPRTAAAREARERGAAPIQPAEVRFLCARQEGEAGYPVLRALVAGGELPPDLLEQARALLPNLSAGGLAVLGEGEAGGLSVATAPAPGSLSKTSS